MGEFDGRSFAARVSQCRSGVPDQRELLSLLGVGGLVALRHGLPSREAARLVVNELQGAARHLALFRCYSGGFPELVSDEGLPTLPGDFPAGDRRTHWPSERDKALNGLPMALILGHELGDSSHPATRDARSLYLVSADARKYFIVDSEPVEDTTAPMARSDFAASGGREDDRRRRAVAGLRELEISNIKGARKLVASQYGVAERTIGKWKKMVEDEDAEAAREGSKSAMWKSLEG